MSVIVHFGKAYPPETGGIETVAESLSRGAVAAGHRVCVIAFTRGETGLAWQQGVEVRRFHASRLGSQPLSWRYLWQGIRRARDSDVVHVHFPNVLAALMSLFVGPRPLRVVHWHSDIIGKGVFGRLVRPLEQRMLRQADIVICTSPPYAAFSPPLRPWQAKVRIVPIGVRPPEPLSDGGLSPRFADFIGRRKLVLAVGRLVQYKGFSQLVEAAAAMPEDSAVVIVGSGLLESALRAQIEELGLAARVMLAGHVDDSELAHLFHAATLFCLPSVMRSEAFGVVLLEAMSRGVPVVTSDIEGSGVPWVNLHGESGLNTPPGDAPALAAACTAILGDATRRRQFSEGARRRYETFFTENLAVERTLAVYAERSPLAPR
jgi:glycosyltransferase involved in cell wall biosynthesis